jgi:DNA-binding CsgD family transcriptional regulator
MANVITRRIEHQPPKPATERLGRAGSGRVPRGETPRQPALLRPAVAEWQRENEDDATRAASLLQRRFGLTARESQLLYWLTRGKSNREMGIILGISARTVDKHLQHVFEKMDVGTRHAAVVQAIEALQPT